MPPGTISMTAGDTRLGAPMGCSNLQALNKFHINNSVKNGISAFSHVRRP